VLQEETSLNSPYLIIIKLSYGEKLENSLIESFLWKMKVNVLLSSKDILLLSKKESQH